ncbi:hypothetical protein HYC85_002250 [Camellia sinensis]|uniref:Uncharacterized protein n=1 Tax=Camellia sinensis TaxID=4442 RepID=A0A7J7I8Z0_CAMSI|nr:hypothetical protein HYC85_002250 [Camellia sinensis]
MAVQIVYSNSSLPILYPYAWSLSHRNSQDARQIRLKYQLPDNSKFDAPQNQSKPSEPARTAKPSSILFSITPALASTTLLISEFESDHTKHEVIASDHKEHAEDSEHIQRNGEGQGEDGLELVRSIIVEVKQELGRQIETESDWSF